MESTERELSVLFFALFLKELIFQTEVSMQLG
jgi:hypothetical protein